MKKLYKALPAVVFIAFIAVMLVLYIALPKEKVSASEKRPLAEMPEFSAEALFSGDFKDDFETYISDHAPGRNFWVGANAYAHLVMGQYSTGHPTPENGFKRGYYVGADGYIINEPQDMTDLMLNVGYIEECAQHMSVPTAVLIAPSAGYICEDKLPALHYTYHDDEYFEKMADTLKTAHFVDIRDAFKSEYADGEQIYYRTDHHWTAYGAYTAYRALAAELGYTPHERGDYEITAYDGFCGTTYSSSGFWLTEPDKLEVWDNKANDGSLSVTIIEGTTYKLRDAYGNTGDCTLCFAPKGNSEWEYKYINVEPKAAGTEAVKTSSSEITDGYYLVGSLGGKNCWHELSADRRLTEDPSAEGVYKLDYTFSDGDEIKIVKVENGEIVKWYNDGEVTEQDEMFYYSHLDEDDKYPVYLDGNHPYTVIKNANASSDEKLLIVKDSFAHSLTPFLADHYSEIIMVDMRYFFYSIPDLVEREGIDRVLFLYSIDNLATDDNIAKIE